jgi:hypothetical protein
MSKKNILEEAIADSKQLKNAAFQNAQRMILENFKSDLKEMVEDQINEMAEEGGDESAPDADLDLSGLEEGGDELGEDDTMALEDELNLSESDESLESESDEEDEDEGGLTEADLSAAIKSALQEVDHAGLGDMEEIDPDSHPTGLMDEDGKEAGWDTKSTPNKKDFTVKEGQYKKRIAALVTENTLLKKTNDKLKSSLAEVNLFNTKLHYAHKLVNKEGLDIKTKKAIVSKFDNVKTVSEAKVLYESIELALGALRGNKPVAKKGTGKPLSEALGITNKGDGANLTEGLHSKEEAAAVDRYKVIAGIIKR